MLLKRLYNRVVVAINLVHERLEPFCTECGGKRTWWTGKKTYSPRTGEQTTATYQYRCGSYCHFLWKPTLTVFTDKDGNTL